MGLLVPKLFIETFGSETNGLIASINQIFGYFSLLEAGIGVASLQALYSPINRENKAEMNSILSATNTSYKKTAFYYFIIVLLFAFIYPLFVNTKINFNIIFLIIIINGSTGVLNFLFQGVYKVLLQAEGKNYIVLNISSIILIFSNILKVYLIIKGYNLIIIQSLQSVFSIFQIVFLNIYIKKNYGWIDFNSTPNYEAISQRKSVLVHQIAALIYNNTDILLLTIFTNLKIVSIYTIYNSITNMLLQFLLNFSNSLTFILGKLINTNVKKLIILFDAYEIFFLTLSFSIMSIVNILLIDFLKIYTKDMTDVNYINVTLGALFVMKILLQAARTPYRQIIDVAGHFRSTRSRAIAETGINLLVSFYFVIRVGIYGVLIGTITSLLLRTFEMIYYTNKNILKRKFIKSLLPWLSNFIIFVFVTKVNFWDNLESSSIIELTFKACIISIIVFIGYFGINLILYNKIIKLFFGNFKIGRFFKKT